MGTTVNKKDSSVDAPHTVCDYYNEVLSQMNRNYDARTLLSKKNEKRFIQELLFEECRNEKIKECINIITPFRATHTVSAFLLGLTIKKYLQFDLRGLRRLPGDKSVAGSFELFWTWICLFHDIGYKIEDNSGQYRDCTSIDALIARLNIKHNLLDESEHGELITKYYIYRVDIHTCVDHGITGALLLYDALIDLAGSSRKYAEIKEYKSFFVTICDTIALHNMWRATPNTVDTYLFYGLTELIPSDNGHHYIVFYKDHPLLFLLAFVDTIEPIKAMCRDQRYRKPMSATEVLENAMISFTNRTGMKKLSLACPHSSFDGLVAAVTAPNDGMMSWLGVYVQLLNSSSEKRLEITIDLSGTNQHDEEKMGA